MGGFECNGKSSPSKKNGLKAHKLVLKIVDCYNPNTFLGNGYLQHGGANKNLGNSSNSQETWRWKWINSRDHLEATDLFESCQSQRIIWALSNHIIHLPSRSLTASFPLKSYRNPIRNDQFSNHPFFQGLCETFLSILSNLIHTQFTQKKWNLFFFRKF